MACLVCDYSNEKLSIWEFVTLSEYLKLLAIGLSAHYVLIITINFKNNTVSLP